MENFFDQRPPAFAVSSLRGVDEQADDDVEGKDDAKGLRQILHDAAVGQEEFIDRPDEDREVKQEGGIGQAADGLAEQAGALGVVIGEQLETFGEASAFLARVDERGIELREPVTSGQARLGEGRTLLESFHDARQRFAK